ncbi:MAG TPA: right-handed parallel beta-helix repeat-containing protein [Propionicimonas sp.]|uniref:right-handed parallel beta-helix repeat-containing protein n=1 Tax=Propionicimonas sp. TaxID=1955623 RepID=UPI002F3F87BF
MKIINRIAAAVAGVVLCASLVPSPADAAPSGIPLRCGMVLTTDATLYLKKDLHCSGFGVSVPGIVGESPYPHVVVDLRGHTLFGPGSADGITAFGNSMTWPELEVRNGRLQGWAIAVGGDGVTSIKNVVVSRNRIGFFCGRGCSVSRSVFRDNTEAGFFGTGESEAAVTSSFFHRNKVGASVWSIPGTLRVSKSIFQANETGVAGYQGSTLVVSGNLFVRNHTAVLYEGLVSEQCATVTGNAFRRNGVDVNGLVC